MLEFYMSHDIVQQTKHTVIPMAEAYDMIRWKKT